MSLRNLGTCAFKERFIGYEARSSDDAYSNRTVARKEFRMETPTVKNRNSHNILHMEGVGVKLKGMQKFLGSGVEKTLSLATRRPCGQIIT